MGRFIIFFSTTFQIISIKHAFCLWRFNALYFYIIPKHGFKNTEYIHCFITLIFYIILKKFNSVLYFTLFYYSHFYIAQINWTHSYISLYFITFCFYIDPKPHIARHNAFFSFVTPDFKSFSNLTLHNTQIAWTKTSTNSWFN